MLYIIKDPNKPWGMLEPHVMVGKEEPVKQTQSGGGTREDPSRRLYRSEGGEPITPFGWFRRGRSIDINKEGFIVPIGVADAPYLRGRNRVFKYTSESTTIASQ